MAPRSDELAYFDHHASNGPTEAINGHLEALRRNALGFRSLTPLASTLTTALRQPRPTNRYTPKLEEPEKSAGYPRRRVHLYLPKEPELDLDHSPAGRGQ